MDKYISKESISSAIGFFKKQNFSKGEQVGLFFYFKAAGMNGDSFITYKKWGGFTGAEKRRNMRVLYDLSGVFDVHKEGADKYASLFPFSLKAEIKPNSFYNGGSKFITLGSRISDTLDNSLVSTFIERSSSDENLLKFKADYISYIKGDLLKGASISLNSLIAWYFRFWKIDVPEGVDDQSLQDCLTLAFLRDFHFTPQEYKELLYVDKRTVSFSESSISGEDLRNMLDITDSSCQPEITVQSSCDYMSSDASISSADIQSMLKILDGRLTEDKVLSFLEEADKQNKEKAKIEALDDTEKAVLAAYQNGNFEKLSVEEKYAEFKDKFGKDAITKLSGAELLYTLFGKKENDSLVYTLEQLTDYFGGITGYRWHLYLYKKDGQWISASNQYGKIITEEEAIKLATRYRDNFVKLFDYIEIWISKKSYLTKEGYSELEDNVKSILGYNFYQRQWVRKYLHMLYPDFFINLFSTKWISKIFRVAYLIPEKNYYLSCWSFCELARKLGILNVYLYHVLERLDDSESDDDETKTDEDMVQSLATPIMERDLEAKRRRTGVNVILYGVPGCGKSYAIKHEYCDDDNRMERVVFHPDYTYSDFVGQILPVLDNDSSDDANGKVVYKFVPGPFTKILKKAFWDPSTDYYLVIEEINRGNAPAIFGDIFQLLDRGSLPANLGESEYGITNSDIANVVYGDACHKVKIPANLSLICTMNTSDQNVFTLDTAFQRRWNMRLVENKFNESDLRFGQTKILDTNVSWKIFCERINNIILTKNVRLASSEDKRLGTHFVTESDLKYKDPSGLNGKERIDAELNNRKFPEKVIKYLWDDAFKFNREEIFDINKFNSLESVIDKFVSCHGDDRFLIFVENVQADLLSGDNSDNDE